MRSRDIKPWRTPRRAGYDTPLTSTEVLITPYASCLDAPSHALACRATNPIAPEGKAPKGLRLVHLKEDSMRRGAAGLRPVLGAARNVSVQHAPQVWAKGKGLMFGPVGSLCRACAEVVLIGRCVERGSVCIVAYVWFGKPFCLLRAPLGVLDVQQFWNEKRRIRACSLHLLVLGLWTSYPPYMCHQILLLEAPQPRTVTFLRYIKPNRAAFSRPPLGSRRFFFCVRTLARKTNFQRGTTIESTPKRTGPTEIAPAPGPLFSGSPLAAGGSVSAATTAAAAAAAFSSPFSPPPPASPLAATISPMASTPATASATSNGATPVPGITTGDPFMGGSGVLGSGLETSPRALAAHALTGFKFTKDMPGAAGVGGGPPIWPACLGGVNTERGEEQHRMGGQAGNNGVSEASAVGGAATDVGGLPSLSMAQLGATSSFHLAMLGMLPAFNALLGSLPPGLQMPQLQPAAGGLQAAPEAPTPSQQQKAGELPVLQPAPFIHAPLLALPKPASDHQQQAKPGQMGPRNAMTMLPATTPTTGVGPAVISEPAAMYNEHPSPAPAQEAPTTLVAIAPAVVHDSTLGPPIAPAPPPVKQPSQGLNLLAMSQELQGGQGGGGLSRAAPGVTAAPTPPIIGSPERGQAGDSSAVAENSIPGISRFRGPSLSRTQSKLRRSCDRCTMRKIRCDGSGIICKR